MCSSRAKLAKWTWPGTDTASLSFLLCPSNKCGMLYSSSVFQCSMKNMNDGAGVILLNTIWMLEKSSHINKLTCITFLSVACHLLFSYPWLSCNIFIFWKRTTTGLMKLNDDSHNTTIIQWSGKPINASSLFPLMTCENKAIKRRCVFILAKAIGW